MIRSVAFTFIALAVAGCGCGELGCYDTVAYTFVPAQGVVSLNIRPVDYPAFATLYDTNCTLEAEKLSCGDEAQDGFELIFDDVPMQLTVRRGDQVVHEAVLDGGIVMSSFSPNGERCDDLRCVRKVATVDLSALP